MGDGDARWRRTVIVVGTLAGVLLLAGCTRTTIDGLQVRSGPSTQSAVVDTIPEHNTSVRVYCWTRGEPIYGHDVWYKIERPTVGYVTSYYVRASGSPLQNDPFCR